jgi:2-keto-4-pentenoate hydratase
MDEASNQSGERQAELQSAAEPRQARATGQRLRALVKNHPVTLLAGAAAVAALAGVELAAGALIGLGAAGLLATDEGRGLRQSIFGRGRNLFRRDPAQAAPPAVPAT